MGDTVTIPRETFAAMIANLAAGAVIAEGTADLLRNHGHFLLAKKARKAASEMTAAAHRANLDVQP